MNTFEGSNLLMLYLYILYLPWPAAEQDKQ